jgi:hypothetical protein
MDSVGSSRLEGSTRKDVHMGSPPRSTEVLSDTLSLSDCHDGFWLYDDSRKMNLAMRANTREDALLDGLKYYQQRLATAEADKARLLALVYGVVDNLRDVELVHDPDPFGLRCDDRA